MKHILADVVSVNTAENGDILSLTTQQGDEITGDLFIDCSGSAGLLIDKHYQVPFLSQKDVLFIDSALAVQVPYEHPDAEIESATLSTAQTAGWIWDIGLSSRRGVGHVFSSRHISDAAIGGFGPGDGGACSQYHQSASAGLPRGYGRGR